MEADTKLKRPPSQKLCKKSHNIKKIKMTPQDMYDFRKKGKYIKNKQN